MGNQVARPGGASVMSTRTPPWTVPPATRPAPPRPRRVPRGGVAAAAAEAEVPLEPEVGDQRLRSAIHDLDLDLEPGAPPIAAAAQPSRQGKGPPPPAHGGFAGP